MIVVIVMLLAIAALTVAMARLSHSDGGPRPTPLDREEDAWNRELPVRPYSERIHP